MRGRRADGHGELYVETFGDPEPDFLEDESTANRSCARQLV
jgi:hypothetical protein